MAPRSFNVRSYQQFETPVIGCVAWRVPPNEDIIDGPDSIADINSGATISFGGHDTLSARDEIDFRRFLMILMKYNS